MGNAFHCQGSQNAGLPGSGSTVDREAVCLLMFIAYHVPPVDDFVAEKLTVVLVFVICLYLYINIDHFGVCIIP
jgi:hypothetical protein